MKLMTIDNFAFELVLQLRNKKLQIVLAESCTGGLVSATLTKIPGVSDCLCGSAVTYLDELKTQWLGVLPQTLAAVTAVSDEVAREMAMGVLNATKPADVAVSITGHLGPDSPAGFDGLIFVCLAIRTTDSVHIESKSFCLTTVGRLFRQIEAAETLFKFATEKLKAAISVSKQEDLLEAERKIVSN